MKPQSVKKMFQVLSFSKWKFKSEWPREKNINPIKAGVFWNHLGWGRGAHCAPPFCFCFIRGPITTKLGMMVLWDKISQKP